MRRTVQDLAWVVAAASVVFFTNLGGPRLWDRDETRNAGCAVEMFVANDWVTPVFNAELRAHKPALTYWFMMLSYSVLGVTEFSARLASALFGVGTCLLTYFIGRRLFDRSVGVWSGVLLSSTLMFGVASRAATPDAPLIFFSTLSLACYVAGSTTAGVSGLTRLLPDWRWTIAQGACMGAAMLAKGPIGIVLPMAVIGMSLLIRRLPERGAARDGWPARAVDLVRPFHPVHFVQTLWSMRPVTVALTAAAIALPWYIAVHLQTDGAWTRGFFITHNLERATTTMDGHRGNVLFYPAALLVGFFPWSIFWLPAVIDRARRLKSFPNEFGASVFAFCWVGVYLALFSLARTKLPSYITPCYPGMAILTGAFLSRWASGGLVLAPIWWRLSLGSLVLVGVGVTIALPVLSQQFLPGEAILGLVGLAPLLGGVLAWWLAERERPRGAVRWTAITAVAFCTLLFAFVAQRIDNHRHLDTLIATAYDGGDANSVDLASFGAGEASWVFYSRQPIEALSSPARAAEFLSAPTSDARRPVLITTDRQLATLREQLDLTDAAITPAPAFLAKHQLLVITFPEGVRTASGVRPESSLR